MSMLHRKLLRDMRRLGGQIATIAIVVAAASGGFLGCMSTYRSLAAARDAYYADARFADVFAPLVRAPRAVAERLSALPGVAVVEVSVRETVRLSLPGVRQPLVAELVGVPAHPTALNLLHLRRGRPPTPGRPLEAVVDEAFAAARGLDVGDRGAVLLNGRQEEFTVVGVGLAPEFVFASAAAGLADPRSYAVLWVAEEPLAAALDLRGAFDHAALRVAPGANPVAVAREVDRVLAPYGGRGAYDRRYQPSHQALSQELEEQLVIGIVLPGAFLWVVGFLLNVVLGRHVATQREQIAALKALGFDDRRILVHYLAFAVLVVGAGLVLGIAVGDAFGEAMTGLYREYFHFPSAPHRLGPLELAIAAGACLATGLAGAWRAVHAAVRISPAQAMHGPTPARYRPLLLERVGAAGWMSPGLRMIVRNLERRPGRALLAATGIAGAGALFVAGTFWSDAIDWLLDAQFGRVDRGDAIVAFDRPVHVSALDAVRRWPGVLEAEPVRAVPARISAGPRERRTTLVGLPPRPALRRVLDGRLHAVTVAPQGVVLAGALAERLRVRAGSVVDVELLDGGRGTARLPVTAVVDEPFGLGAYVEMSLLNRLAGQGEVLDAIDLRYAEASEAQLNSAWLATPRVRSATVARELLASFHATTARNLLVFTSIVAAFAAAVAFGVVYNSARVALAERQWELASLRVLGFTREEVAALLLGELAIVLAVAIPLGLVLGRGLSGVLAGLVHGEQFRIPVVIAPRTYVLAIALMTCAGVVSALLVRRRIAALDLVAVLKVRE